MVTATDIGYARMRVSKVVALNDGDGICEFVVLNELDGDRHLVIQIGSAEAFALAASLGCVRLGVIGVAGVALGMAAGMVATAAAVKPAE